MARIEAGWDHDLDGDAAVQVDEGSGAVTVTISTGTYCHTDISSADKIPSGNYTDFASALETALNNAASLSLTYTVTWDGDSEEYTIGVSSTGASLSFSGAAQVYMRNILGFSGNQSTATSHVSDQVPWYVISAEMDAWSSVTDDYEDREIAYEAVTDSGSTYLISRTESPVLSDWTVRLEPKEAVYGRAAPSDEQWTWQDFFEHCRKGRPFARIDSLDSSAHKLRAEGASFRPRFVAADWDQVRDVRILSYNLGYLST